MTPLAARINRKPTTGLDETGRRRHADVRRLQQCAINKSVNGIRHFVQRALIHGHLIKQAKIRSEDLTELQYHQRNHGWFQQGNGDVADLLPFRRAIQLGGLIIILAEADNG